MSMTLDPHALLDEPALEARGQASPLARWADSSQGLPEDLRPLAEPAPAPEKVPQALLGLTVMMVDDEPLMTDVVQTYLEEAGYRRFVAVNDPLQALAVARAERPAVLLLDLMMPALSGFEILERLRQDEALRFLPVIVLTAAANPATKLRALELGATEFLAKPVDASELVLRVRNSLVFKVYQDRLASEDPLTGLPNRRTFVERLRAVLAAPGIETRRVGLLHVALDRFKQVNDSLGHAAGDRLLAAVAERLRTCMRRTGQLAGGRGHEFLLARLGGDEFGMLLPGADAPASLDRVARRVLAAMSRPLHVDGQQLYLTPSIGIALAPDDGLDDEMLMRGAGAAAQHAKRSGRNTFRFYSEALNTASIEQLGLETELYHALDKGELELHFQPKVDLANGRVCGAEALVRWHHPRLGLVPPDRFVPIAEEMGLIVSFGAWAIDRACAELAAWRAAGLGELGLAVNVSRHELMAGGLVDCVAQALARHAIAPQRLTLEITESMVLDRVGEAQQQFEALRILGVRLSVDDFGTGWSSMSYLKRFRVDELKIDRSFVSGTPDDATDAAIVRALVVLAKSVGLTVVAEGVETEAQRAFLASIGCDKYQGWLCSKALPAPAFLQKVLETRAAG